jgi:hypothetical protein
MVLEKGGGNQLDRCVKIEEVLQGVKEEMNVVHTKEERLTGLGTSCVETTF